MSKSLRTKIVKYAIASIACLLVAYGYAASRNFSEQILVEQYRILCDAFTIPGAMMVLLGMLIGLGNLGALDSVAYLLSYLVRIFAPAAFDPVDSYLDFVESRREKRVKGYGFLYVVGGISLAIAIVFLILFYSLYQK